MWFNPTGRTFGLLLGPAVFLGLKLFYQPEGLSEQGLSVLASTAWVAIWWISEAIEVEVTALLPIVLFPMTGGLGLGDTCAAYGHKFIFLFVGGFILAIAIQKWNLHKRMALTIIQKVGTDPYRIILGFMVSTAFLSMWISNTATTVMMLPIGLAVASQFKPDARRKNLFGTALLLSIAYSASIGGIATLIGTPPNLILAGVIQESFGIELTFVRWMYVGLPISILLLVLCWLYLTRVVLRTHKIESVDGQDSIDNQIKALGPVSYEEKMVLAVFGLTAVLWITRSFVLNKYIPAIDDTIIAIGSALILFVLPTHRKKGPLIAWKDAVKLPWGVLILFGGGISIAVAFQDSGLASWIAANLKALSALHIAVILLLLIASVNFLTEITSNLATTSVLLPVLVSLSLAIDVHPFVLMVAATLAASCAFMLPVATPPNAIVFSSDHIHLRDMIRAGLWMNLVSIALITLFVYFVLPVIWQLDLSTYPDLFN